MNVGAVRRSSASPSEVNQRMLFPARFGAAALAAMAIATSWTLVPVHAAPMAPARAGWHDLFRAAPTLADDWQHVPLHGSTDYRPASIGGRTVIAAEGRQSASMLLRRVEIDPVACPTLEWSWRVDQVQSSADLTRRDGDDVAAAIIVLFGDPGGWLDPRPVPTLRYVWAGAASPIDSIVDNPYLPGVVKSIVVRSGDAATGRWRIERRSWYDDFRRAFGHEPGDRVAAIGLFTDNDQTGDPAHAYYEWGRVRCAGG